MMPQITSGKNGFLQLPNRKTNSATNFCFVRHGKENIVEEFLFCEPLLTITNVKELN